MIRSGQVGSAHNCSCINLPKVENNLQSHDIQIPVPKPKWKDVIEMFNIILLSSCDMQPSTNAIARVEQLYQRTGGSNIGVILLLQEESPQSNGTMDFMELQMG